MKCVTHKPMTLRQMRDAKGLNSHEAAEKMAELLGRPSYDFSSILKAEADGIENARILSAYATLYGQSLEAIYEAVGIPYPVLSIL